MMIKTTQSIIDHEGRTNLPHLLGAARGRCTAAHFGTYDYTAICQITAVHQHMTHPSCDFAPYMIYVSFGGTCVLLSDFGSYIMAFPAHLSPAGGASCEEQE